MIAAIPLPRWLQYFNALSGIIGQTGYGFTSWQPIVSDKPWYSIQCDLSVMISPKMFERFVLPSLNNVSTAIGQTIYHLDGPGEIQHLDMLLSLPHINAIQWTPLPISGGKIYQDFADPMSFDIYRRTKAAGKKMVLLTVHPSQIEAVINEAGADSFFMNTRCKTRSEAEELIAAAQKKHWIK